MLSLENPLVRLLIGGLVLIVIINIIFAFFGVIAPPALLLDAFNWGLSIIWSLNFIIDIPALLFWFQLLFRFAILSIMVNTILFVVGLYAKMK